mmetsp:Transcript_29200/g.86427  ORF Transcript_29200/g.86427 Transcript_29200/m.86427 type:complete len:231 (-) Transcript_29200:589-1281(-)
MQVFPTCCSSSRLLHARMLSAFFPTSQSHVIFLPMTTLPTTLPTMRPCALSSRMASTRKLRGQRKRRWRRRRSTRAGLQRPATRRRTWWKQWFPRTRARRLRRPRARSPHSRCCRCSTACARRAAACRRPTRSSRRLPARRGLPLLPRRPTARLAWAPTHCGHLATVSAPASWRMTAHGRRSWRWRSCASTWAASALPGRAWRPRRSSGWAACGAAWALVGASARWCLLP